MEVDEDDDGTLVCPNGAVLSILEANYGNSWWTRLCRAVTSYR